MSLTKTQRSLVLIAAVALAPIVASYAAYYFWPRDARVNYGDLIAAPAPEIRGLRLDGSTFRLSDLRGKWLVVFASGGECDAACEKTLYATRQARTMQGRDQDRITRVWLATGGATPAPARLGDHPGLEVVRAESDTPALFPGARGRSYLIDPLGNLVLSWPADPDVKALAKDLERLLRASQIG